MPYLAMLKNPLKNSYICTLDFQNTINSSLSIDKTMAKFLRRSDQQFYVCLLTDSETDRQTYRQTDRQMPGKTGDKSDRRVDKSIRQLLNKFHGHFATPLEYVFS